MMLKLLPLKNRRGPRLKLKCRLKLKQGRRLSRKREELKRKKLRDSVAKKNSCALNKKNKKDLRGSKQNKWKCKGSSRQL